MRPRTISRYGWIPDHPDPRDRLYNLEAPIRRAHQLPRKIAPLTDTIPVPRWNQAQLGSCTGHGIVRALAYEAVKQGEPLKLAAGRMDDNTPGDAGYSRLFVYYEERRIEGTIGTDSGGQIRDGIKVVATEGAPLEQLWPYDVSQFAVKPSPAAYKAAPAHEAVQYRRIVPDGPGAPVHTALANGQVVVFGFIVPASFEDGTWDPSSGDPLPLPAPGEQFVGGHCTVIVGYDLDRKLFVVDNSWGEDWGIAGRFNMTQAWVDPYRGLSSDFWVVERVT